MNSTTHHTGNSSGKYICFFLILFFGILLHVSAQKQHFSEIHNCSHLCAQTRSTAPTIGIYPQDPRVHDFDVKFYGLDIEVNPSSRNLTGSVRVVAEIVADQTREIVLEIVNALIVSGVEYNDQEISFTQGNNLLVIELARPFAKGELIDLTVFYSGTPPSEGFFSGLTSAQNSFEEPVLWTLSEPHNARQWFPVKQVLEDKADSVWVFITTPAEYTAASNGLLHQVVSLPGERNRYEWKSYYPIAYYLISMAVANYQEYNFYTYLPRTGDSLLIQNFIYNHPQVLASQRENLERTRDFMTVFSQFWGNYPFASEKYGHAQAPMGGAMEHQTISTMGHFGFDITAHELAHHWFGNHVTCATWSDIWINEGFASYGEFMAREFISGRERANQWMRAAHDNIKSAAGGSVYVPTMELGDVMRIFNGRLSYRKGAAILHQLRFEINNDELFFQVFEDFQNEFAHSVATGDDFRRTAEATSQMELEWFFDLWYYGEGYPFYNIQWKQQDQMLIIRSQQTATTQTTPFFAGSIEFKAIGNNVDEIFRVFQDQPIQEFEIPISDKIDELIFDPYEYMLASYTVSDFTDRTNQIYINIAPNPVNQFIQIEAGSAWYDGHFNISDLQGRILLQGIVVPALTTIDLTSLQSGLYLVNFYSKSGDKSSKKLIKN
jgi:aminopeptidase N